MVTWRPRWHSEAKIGNEPEGSVVEERVRFDAKRLTMVGSKQTGKLIHAMASSSAELN